MNSYIDYTVYLFFLLVFLYYHLSMAACIFSEWVYVEYIYLQPVQ